MFGRWHIPGVGSAPLARSQLARLRDGTASDGETELRHVSPPWEVGGALPTVGAVGEQVESLGAWSWLRARHRFVIRTSQTYPIQVFPRVEVTGSMNERLQAILWWAPIGAQRSFFLEPDEVHTSLGVGYCSEDFCVCEFDIIVMVDMLSEKLNQVLVDEAPFHAHELSLAPPPWPESYNFGLDEEWTDCVESLMAAFERIVSSDPAWRVRRPRPAHISWR